MSFSNFLEAVKTVEYGFKELFELFGAFLLKFFESEHIASTLAFTDSISAFLPIGFLIVSLIVAFFGKKLFKLLRFIFFFIVGGLAGIYTLAPIILGVMPSLPVWVIGIVTGVIAGILAKIVYFLALAVAAGYSVYIVMYQGLIPGVSALTEGSWLVGAIAAGVAIVIVFALLKYIEIFGTAILGGWGVATTVLVWWNYLAIGFIAPRPWLGILIFTAVVAIPGAIVQLKTRKRYI